MVNKMFIIRLCLIAVLVLSFSVTAPSSARANEFFDFFFPTKSNEPNPAITLKAPFADEDAVIEEMDASGNAANQTPLHLRHRTNETITLWIQKIIPEMITYKTLGYEDQYREKIINFNKAGSIEYLQFLRDRNFITTLKTGHYDIAGFISDYPVILNEGAIDGHYRWLYQMNIMVTYIDSETKNYLEIKKGSAITQEFVLTFQIGRSRTATNEHGIEIESWNIKPTKAK